MPDESLLRRRDVAALADVSIATVDRAIKAGTLKAFRLTGSGGPGGAIRIDRSDVEAWLAASRGDGRGKRQQSAPTGTAQAAP